jgi:DNA-binding LacI/PurR family transcriptional regulator
VIWDSPAALATVAAARRPALCLNDRPPPGLAGVSIDAVTTDDFSGGACAAELLKQRTRRTDGFVVLGGPAADARSRQRIAGFLAHVRDARVVCAESWFVEGGAAAAADVLRGPPAGIFACNDRLAQAVLAAAAAESGRAAPPLVGFDNAPIATRLRLTSIGIPWTAFVTESLDLIRARLAGRTDGGRLVCLAHEPALRLTC